MVQRVYRAFLLLLWVAALCGSLHAQTQKTITIRLLDGKTGRLVSPENFMVRIDHQQTIHIDWVKHNEDGTGELKVPDNISVFSLHATYNNSMDIYVNCDAAKQGDTPGERWYTVADILTAGFVTPNGCAKPKVADKLKVAAKPGELVVFVRRHNWMEQSKD